VAGREREEWRITKETRTPRTKQITMIQKRKGGDWKKAEENSLLQSVGGFS